MKLPLQHVTYSFELKPLMNIVFFTHPTFLGSQSMPRFARMLAEGMQLRGHTVELWSPQPLFYKIKAPLVTKKWLGYVDQFIVFPGKVRMQLKSYPADTIFVITDHALGPWVPLIADRPHIIHCHDFLAQRSALGDIPENPTSWTGQQYQSFIHRGYCKGKWFVSVSEKTKEDLHRFLSAQNVYSKVVYNGLNKSFTSGDAVCAREQLGKHTGHNLEGGYLLHVGGNQWYKNRVGVIEIYNAWRNAGSSNIPLLMVGKNPDKFLQTLVSHSPYKSDIHFLCGLEDNDLHAAYVGASLLLFPSIAEGFGWPIAEAMASGCPVITTNEAPMTEVGGGAAFYIPRRPYLKAAQLAWSEQAAKVIDKVLQLTQSEREAVIIAGLNNAKRFNLHHALDRIEAIYKEIINSSKGI